MSDGDPLRLGEVLASAVVNSRVWRRCRALQQVAAGENDADAGKAAGLVPSTVCRLRQRYARGGISSVFETNTGQTRTRGSKYPGFEERFVRSYLREKIKHGKGVSLADVRAAPFGLPDVSPRSKARILMRHGYQVKWGFLIYRRVDGEWILFHECKRTFKFKRKRVPK